MIVAFYFSKMKGFTNEMAAAGKPLADDTTTKTVCSVGW
jgi:hypothetical protein